MDSTSSLTIQPSSKTFVYWASQPFIPQTLREQILNADILITPEPYRDLETGKDQNLFFPQGTEDVFQFLQTQKPDNLNLDICIDDEDYQELTLHFDFLTLPDIVVTLIAAPVVANLITEYIKYKLGSRQDKTIVKAKITIIDEKRSVETSYEGPASEFEKFIGPIFRSIGSSEGLTHLEDATDLDDQQRIQRLSDHKGSKKE